MRKERIPCFTGAKFSPMENGADRRPDREARQQDSLKLMIDLEKLELFKGIRRKSFELSLCPDG